MGSIGQKRSRAEVFGSFSDAARVVMPRFQLRYRKAQQTYKKSRPSFRFRGRSFWNSKFSRRVRTVVRSQAEKKRITYDLVTDAPHEVDRDGRLHHLTAIADGAAINQRTGRRITPSALSMRFAWQRLTNTDNPITCTIMVVRDTQQVGDTSPAASDILANVGTGAAGLGILNKQNTPRFQVLMRRTFQLADVQSGVNAYLIDEYVRLAPINVGYNGSGSGDIERNGLYMLMISGGDPLLDEIKVTGEATLYYSDV